MTFNPPLGHEELLTLTREARAAARDADPNRVQQDALRLFEALADHVGAERLDLLRVPPGESRLLLRGQQRVIDLIVDLAVEAASAGTCRCEAVADQLLAQLTLQVDDERLSLPSPCFT